MNPPPLAIDPVTDRARKRERERESVCVCVVASLAFARECTK